MGAEMAEDRADISPAEEKEAIKDILSAAQYTMEAGDKFHLLSARWWKLWQSYTDYDDTASTIEDLDPLSGYLAVHTMMSSAPKQRPPPIDNSGLVAPSSKEAAPELKEGLAEESDYVLLPDDAWKKLHGWYGGGPDFVRLVISVGQNSSNVVEVYPFKLKMVRPNKIYPNGSRICEISRRATVKDLFTWSAKAFSLEESEFRLWDFFEKRKKVLLSDPDTTLEDAKIQSMQQILVEERKDGIWPDDSEKLGSDGEGPAAEGDQEAGPSEAPGASQVILLPAPKPTTYMGPQTRNRLSTDSDSWFGSTTAYDGPKGLTGLSNLGNTCFMNSALQCLTHTPQLVEYFLQDFTKEINRTNPLGMKGELATAFGELLRKLWAGNRSPVAPRNFKSRLAHFAPQFSGYNQHDSQELLAFLLDGLHEDLNRVKKKPYIEAKDSDGRPDEEVADEAWEMHKARNDSIIVDVCQGQYKSTLVCPECQKTSITFDPFMYLSLPLPDKTTRSMNVTVYSGEGRHPPQEVMVTLRKSGRMRDLYEEVAKKVALRPDEELILGEVYQQKIWQWIDLTEYSAQVKHDDLIAAFRVPKGTSASQYVLVYHLKKALYSHEAFATPLLAPLPKEGLQSPAQLQGIVETLLRPFERKLASTSDSDETGNDTGAGPSARGEENGAHEQSSSQEITMTEVNDGEEDNGANEATSAKSGTEHYEDAEDADANGDEDMDEISTPQAASTANRMSMDTVDLGGPSTADPEPPGKGKRLRIVKTSEKSPSNFEELASGPFPSGAVRGFYDQSRYPTVAIVWTEEDLARYDLDRCHVPAPFEKQEAVSTKPRGEEVTLAACLEAFLKEEPLGVDDMWYCPTCKQHRQASKKLDLWRLPEVLVVHLKRFSYTRWHKSKLDTFVDFPMDNLDLAPYSAGPDDGNSKYELFAVSNHFGGMGGGHYTANAKVEDEWYNFDDSHVSSTQASSVRSSSAYVLFYRRKHSGLSSVGNGPEKGSDDGLATAQEEGTTADGEMLS